LGRSEQFASDNPNICVSCACLMDDVQESTIIESAIPYELEHTAGEHGEVEPALVTGHPNHGHLFKAPA
jgi:hypothetical protein